MTHEEREYEMVEKIRILAGEIGEVLDPLPFPNEADCENYDFQVQTGLAFTVAYILNHNAYHISRWLGYVFLYCDLVDDAGLNGLLTGLEFYSGRLQDQLIEADDIE